MDKIQKILIKAGREDLAQKYFERVSFSKKAIMAGPSGNVMEIIQEAIKKGKDPRKSLAKKFGIWQLHVSDYANKNFNKLIHTNNFTIYLLKDKKEKDLMMVYSEDQVEEEGDYIEGTAGYYLSFDKIHDWFLDGGHQEVYSSDNIVDLFEQDASGWFDENIADNLKKFDKKKVDIISRQLVSKNGFKSEDDFIKALKTKLES